MLHTYLGYHNKEKIYKHYFELCALIGLMTGLMTFLMIPKYRNRLYFHHC